VVICLEQGADCLHMVQLMPLHPINPDWLYLSGTGLARLSWKRGRHADGCSSSRPSGQTEPVCMCSPEWITATSIICKTSPVLAASSVPVTLKFGESSLALDDQFVYTENPVVTDIRPRDTFLRCVIGAPCHSTSPISSCVSCTYIIVKNLTV